MSAGGSIGTPPALNRNDPVITQFAGAPEDYYYYAGFEEPEGMLGMAYATAKAKLTEQWVLQAARPLRCAARA